MMIKYLGFAILVLINGVNMYAFAGDESQIVIAHRGASGYLPEHTLEAYRLGIEQGADYIEPDFVLTKDGHFVARHDIYLSTTTDVADRPEFAERKRTIKGKEDWYVFDFTLAEIKTLFARQPWEARDQSYNDTYRIPTFEEILGLVKEYNSDTAKQVGLYPEMKQPSVFKANGLDAEAPILKMFSTLNEADIPFYFQCFDPNFIINLRPKTDAKLIMLLYEIEDKEKGGVKANIPFNLYQNSVDGIGISKALLVDHNGLPTGIVKTAHDLGLKVHVWTIRDDIVPDMFENSTQEMKAVFALGVDGVFADFPDTARGLVNTLGLAGKVVNLE
jgi:glycerophosphoryl diester phosphodiesterase